MSRNNKFGSTVAKICDEKKLVIFCNESIIFLIEKYIRKELRKTKCTYRLALSAQFSQLLNKKIVFDLCIVRFIFKTDIDLSGN